MTPLQLLRLLLQPKLRHRLHSHHSFHISGLDTLLSSSVSVSPCALLQMWVANRARSM